MLLGSVSRRTLLEELSRQIGDEARKSEARRRIRSAIETIDRHFRESFYPDPDADQQQRTALASSRSSYTALEDLARKESKQQTMMGGRGSVSAKASVCSLTSSLPDLTLPASPIQRRPPAVHQLASKRARRRGRSRFVMEPAPSSPERCQSMTTQATPTITTEEGSCYEGDERSKQGGAEPKSSYWKRFPHQVSHALKRRHGAVLKAPAMAGMVSGGYNF